LAVGVALGRGTERWGRQPIQGRKGGLVVAVLALAGCDGIQSATNPGGRGADAIYGLWSVFLAVCIVVWLLVMAALLWAMLRRGEPHPMAAKPELQADPNTKRRLRRTVELATLATLVILLGLTGATYAVVSKIFPVHPHTDLTIELTGHRWWWEARYILPGASAPIVTANEIHLPVGADVTFVLRSDDVIHSLWVPNLDGKMDLIPGQTNTLTMRADRPGTYRGQCAEFCGLQHAYMALFVVAEPPSKFEQWLEAQRRPAPVPDNPDARRGLDVFVANCASCHRVRGTAATATVGPDLTHLASRATIGAGRLPNTPGNFGGWVADAQQQKPGVLMPPMRLPPADLQSVLHYLGTLR
jgi:cytochrome c oxidase subunit II